MFDGIENTRKRRMLDYLLEEAAIGVRAMLRDNSAIHVFNYDKQGQYVFVMAVLPKSVIPEDKFKATESLAELIQTRRADTTVQRETEKTEEQTTCT